MTLLRSTNGVQSSQSCYRGQDSPHTHGTMCEELCRPYHFRRVILRKIFGFFRYQSLATGL